jgi:hypothetical protein
MCLSGILLWGLKLNRETSITLKRWVFKRRLWNLPPLKMGLLFTLPPLPLFLSNYHPQTLPLLPLGKEIIKTFQKWTAYLKKEKYGS